MAEKLGNAIEWLFASTGNVMTFFAGILLLAIVIIMAINIWNR